MLPEPGEARGAGSWQQPGRRLPPSLGVCGPALTQISGFSPQVPDTTHSRAVVSYGSLGNSHNCVFDYIEIHPPYKNNLMQNK